MRSWCFWWRMKLFTIFKTRQVAGRHGEIEADAFALKMLEQYRESQSKAELPR